MKTYEELKAEMEQLEKDLAAAKERERKDALKKVRELCKEFGFTAGMLKGCLAEGRKTKAKAKPVSE
ncbi:MAG: DNA-binding protein H-NS [Alcanivorax borkumensis]|jgi:DNA-binding protein H-NS